MLHANKKVLIFNSDSTSPKYNSYEKEYLKQLSSNIIVEKVDENNIYMNLNSLEYILKTKKPDIIFCIGSLAYQAASQVAKGHNKLFCGILNWKRFNVENKAFGIANELPARMQLFTIRNYFSDIKKLGIIYTPQMNKEWIKEVNKIASQMDFQIISKPVNNPEQVLTSLDGIINEVDALWLIPDPSVVTNKKLLNEYFKRANQANKMIFTYNDFFVKAGAALALTADIRTIASQAVIMTESILEKGKILQKIQYPAGIHITVNLKKINQLNANLNYKALRSANKILK
ncbi:ABC transporter substrate-binding protein [Candidatus Margulisiibacteriota bacterium]